MATITITADKMAVQGIDAASADPMTAPLATTLSWGETVRHMAFGLTTSALNAVKRKDLQRVALRLYFDVETGETQDGRSQPVVIATGWNVGSTREELLQDSRFMYDSGHISSVYTKVTSTNPSDEWGSTDGDLAESESWTAVNLLRYGVMLYQTYRHLSERPTPVSYTTLAAAANRPAFVVTYTDIPLRATNLSPANTYLNRSEAQLFSWGYTSDSYTALESPVPQSAQVRWRNTTTGESGTVNADTALAHTFPANFFIAGDVQWSVRITSNDGVQGDWSDWQLLSIVGAPPTPVLQSVTGTTRPLINWTAPGQEAFRIVISEGPETVLDTGFVPGTANSYQVLEYLEDGNYNISLYVKNRNSLVSDPTVTRFTVAQPTMTKPTIAAAASNGAVGISVDGGYPIYYIFRNGIPVKKLENAIDWIDYTANGETTYFARGVDANDNFADSDPAMVNVKISGSLLSSTEDPEKSIQLRFRRHQNGGYDFSVDLQASAVHYAGRRLPVMEFGEAMNKPVHLSFSFFCWADYETLVKLIEENITLLYRAGSGERYYMAVTNLSAERGGVSTDFNLSAEKVDFVERIQFDPPEVVS